MPLVNFGTSWLVIAVALLLFTTPIANAQDKAPILPPGIHDQTLPQKNGPVIHYAISVPPRYHGEPVPLVLALHFGGDPAGAGRSMLDILVLPALGELGAVIVAPDSLSGGWSSPQNEQAVNALLAAVEKGYAIDPKKVIVTGYSMGGAGTWYWAEKYPERFSAAVAVSGRPTPVSPNWRVPILAIHSGSDEVNPIAPTIQRINELKTQGVNAELMVVTDVSHYQTGRFVPALRRAVPWIEQVWKTK